MNDHVFLARWHTPQAPEKKPSRPAGVARARIRKEQDVREALNERMCDLDASMRVDPRSLSWGGNALLDIDRFASRCAASGTSGKLPFRLDRQDWKITDTGRDLLPLLQPLELFSLREKADTQYSPHIQLAIDAFRLKGLHMSPSYLGYSIAAVWNWMHGDYAHPTAANLCNAFVQAMGRSGSERAFERRLQAHRTLHDRRTAELQTHFDTLLSQRPRSHLIRLELCVCVISTNRPRDEFRLMLNASTQWVGAVHKQFGKAIVFDVRKIDIAQSGRYMVHVLLAVDGPTEQERPDMREAMHQSWIDLMPYGAYSVNCDAQVLFQHRGTGSQAKPLAQQLEQALVYFTSTDRFCHVGFGGMLNGLTIGDLLAQP